ETVRKAENRDGSRNYFGTTVLALDNQVEKAAEELLAATHKEAETAADAAHASAGSGTHAIVLITLFAIALAIGVAIAVTRSAVRPVKELPARMVSLEGHCPTQLPEALAAVADGDLPRHVEPVTTPIEVRSTDELGRLSATFNDMLGKAQHS